MTSKHVCLLLLFLFTAVVVLPASAATVVTQGCGSIGVSANNQPGPPFPPISPSISTTLIGCPAFTIPAGNTLLDVSLSFQNDWQLGADGVDTLVFAYAISGFNIPSMTATVTGAGLTGSVPPAGAIPFSCTVLGEIITCNDPVSITGTFNAIGLGVNAVWALGGLDFAGSEGTTVSEVLTYDQLGRGNPTPEPASFLLAGCGLIGLGLTRYRKSNNKVGR